MSDPIPYWRSDRDYYPRGDTRREQHIAHIEAQNRINTRICASSGDGSYSVILTRREAVE